MKRSSRHTPVILTCYGEGVEQADAADIDKKYATVRELLAATCAPENLLGTGIYACGYKFPDPLALPYILRARKDRSIPQLLSTSSLVPLPELLHGTNVGQPLMGSGSQKFQELCILHRQSGDSLSNIFKQLLEAHKNDDHSEAEAAIDMIRLMRKLYDAHEINPFVSILITAQQLRKRGILPDLSAGNILYDWRAGSLGLVDQTPINNVTVAHNPLPLFQNGIRKDGFYDASRLMLEISKYGRICNTIPLSSPIGLRYKAQSDWLEKMLLEARAQVTNTPTTALPPIGFSKVSASEAVALSAPPSKLVAELNRLMGIVNAPQR
jgi:hypothetical protein